LLTTTGYKSYHFSKDRAQALYLAEAGISSAIREIKGGEEEGSISDATLAYSDGSLAGSYSVEWVLDGSSYTLTSSGIVNKGSTNEVKRRVSAKYTKYSVPGGGEGIEEFKHIASYETSCSQCLIDLGAYETSNMPIPNMNFFLDNADHIHESGFASVNGESLDGVYYVQGNATLGERTTLNGTIVVDGGTLTIEEGCTIDPSNNPVSSKQDFPAVVVYGEVENTGEVTIERAKEINGLIYVSRIVDISANCKVTGVIIADEIRAAEGRHIEYEKVSPPDDAFSGGTPSGGGTVSLESGSWQELSQ